MFLKRRGKIAIHYKNEEITFNTVVSKVFHFSSLFDISKGDRVIIFAENSPEWMYAFHSIWENKGVAVPVDYLATAKELAYIINDCHPELVFYTQERKEVLEKALEDVDYQPQLIDLDSLKTIEVQDDDRELADSDFDETAVIIYTSGTTGSPKGVMLSFDNILANIEAVTTDVNIFSKETRMLILLPLHHIFPLLGSFVAPLSIGATLAIAPSMASEDIIGTLQTFQLNTIIGVPRLYSAIRKGIMDKINKNIIAKGMFALAGAMHSYSFSKFLFKSVHKKFGGQIKYMVCGGAPLDTAVARDFQVLGFRVLEGYGMTEAAPMITFTRPNKIKVGSAGHALSGCQIDFVDGEIIAKGRNIMQGYFNRPKETAEVLKDGWLYTGDLAQIDKKGYVSITGRKKEIIVLSNGKNINPVDIEFYLEAKLPFIQELAVFEKNDHLHLAVFPNRAKMNELGVSDLETEIRDNVIKEFNDNASSYKKIHQIYVASEELPKTRLGKIQRFKLKDLEQSEKKRQQKSSSYNSEEYSLIKEHIENDKKIEVLPENHMEIDLGLDSLDKISLQVFIENTFGVKISAERFEEYPTVKRLSEFVKKMKTKINIEKIHWDDILKEKVNINLPKSGWFHALTVRFNKLILRTYFRVRIKGAENIPDEACIITPNHQSYLDGMFLMSSIKSSELKDYYFYAKAKHVKNKLLKRWANKHNIIVVDINKDVKFSIQALAEVLKQDKKVIIFPEGTRSKTGDMGEFKKTFAILSKELNIPVVPVAIQGAYEALPRGSRFPRPFKKIIVEFLKPIMPGRKDYDALAELTKDNIQKVIEK